MRSIFAKTTALLCVILLLFSLTACGDEKADTSETAASTAETTANADSAATEAAQSPTEAAPADATEAAQSNDADASASDLVGSWDYAEISGFVYTFNADGTGTYDVLGEIMNFKYTADGSTIKFTYEDLVTDAPMELEYEIDGDTLNIKDSLGVTQEYHRK